MVDALKGIEGYSSLKYVRFHAGPNRDCSLLVGYFEKVVSVSNRRNKNKMKKGKEKNSDRGFNKFWRKWVVLHNRRVLF